MSKSHGASCWLDVKMPRCDVEGMHTGVRTSVATVVILSSVYFSRDMCRQECQWALGYKKTIIPLIPVEEKLKANEYLAEGKKHGIDLEPYGVIVIDRSSPATLADALEAIMKRVA